MAITPGAVWQWMPPSATREGETVADVLMTRIVDAVETYWLEFWSVLIADDEGVLPDPRPVYIDQALIMQAASLYDRRRTPNGVIAGSAELGPIRVSRFDPDVERLLNDQSWGVA